MMTLTTYPATHERSYATRATVARMRADIDRLTAIIARLNFVCDKGADTIHRLRHEIEVQTARAEVAEALVRKLQGPPDKVPSIKRWWLS